MLRIRAAVLLRLGAAIVFVAAAAVAAVGCPCVPDGEDDDFEDNDKPEDAKALDASSVVSGTVAECDADFFSFDLGDDELLDLFLSGPQASVESAGDQFSGGVLVGVTGSDGGLLNFALDSDEFGGEGEGEGVGTGTPTTPTASTSFQGSNSNVHIVIPTGFGDRYVIDVKQSGYADNIFPVINQYTLSLSAGAP